MDIEVWDYGIEETIEVSLTSRTSISKVELQHWSGKDKYVYAFLFLALPVAVLAVKAAATCVKLNVPPSPSLTYVVPAKAIAADHDNLHALQQQE